MEALSARQVCNAAYSAITMWMDTDDHKHFDRELLAPVGNAAAPVSRGTKGLMAVMGVSAPRRVPSRPPAEQG